MINDTLPPESLDHVRELRREMDGLDKQSRAVGQAMGQAFTSATLRGRDLGSVLRTLAMQMSSLALREAVAPLTQAIGQAATSAIGAILPFAKGGVVNSPTTFPMAQGTGLMGEAGAEAILPLARGPDGRLGVRSEAGGATSVNITINARDVDSFRRSQGEITAALVQAMNRGQRHT